MVTQLPSCLFQTSSVSTMDHVLLFLSYLNRQHPNIFFSSELEKDGRLPFLDIEITRSNGRFSTSVYRKPTFTGLFTNFHSFVPLAYKRSLVCCLLHRIFHLCSSYENFHVQLASRKDCQLEWFPHSHVRSTCSSLPQQALQTQTTSLHSSALKLHGSARFAVLLILILTFALSFAPLHASPLSFSLRIKFLLYTYLSVDAVPHRMWVKPLAIYTPEYLNTWASLL